MDEARIKEALGKIEDPVDNNTLKANDAIRHIGVEDDKVTLLIGMRDPDDQKAKQKLRRELASVIKRELGFKGVRVEFEPLKKQGSVLERDVRYIGIASGKGGVGKSTVAANLALALQRIGKRVGIIDADIYGSNIPVILDMPIELPGADENERIRPFEKHGIEVSSTEFFIKEDKPVMWRGPMLSKMLNHFFYDIGWSEDVEYLIVDLPPGTGDVAIDIQKYVPSCKMVIVTTPHPSASSVALKAGLAARELDHDILGVVENMSYLDHGDERLKIFGEGGGDAVAQKLGVDVLQRIPVGQPKSGHHSLFGAEEEIGVLYLGLANKLIKSL